MGNIFIKIITSIALISIFFLQGIWLYNTYNLLESELKEKLDVVFTKSIEKEVYLRLNSPDRQRSDGKIVEGVKPDNNPEENALAFQEYLYFEGCEFDFTSLDSILNQELSSKIGTISYSLKRIDSKGKTLDSVSHGTEKDIQTAFYVKTLPIRMNHAEAIKATIVSPYKVIIKEMFALLIASGIIAIIIGYCIFLQIKIIIRQDKIAEIRQDFTYAMIHDMRNPITTILMGIQTLKSGKLDDKAKMKEQYFNILTEESNHLFQLSDKILTIAKFENSKIKLTKQQLDLPKIINSLINKFKIETRKQVNFSVNFDHVNYVFADLDYLNEVLRNLIDNAIKYSYDPVNIDINCISKDRVTQIKIKDNGFGISLKDQKRIFDKFERATFTNKTAGPTGFGLGLNYVYHVITAHGGDIKVDSIKGSFSEFTISLPDKDD